jgi:hypothetical protein
MKKIYIVPRVKNMFVDEEEMICVSLNEEGSAKSGGIKEADSREDSFIGGPSLWDEEE